MIFGDRLRDVLQEDGLTGAGRGDDQRALTLADGGHDIDHAAGAVFLGRIERLHVEALVRVKGREVVERHLVAGALGVLEVDGGDADEGKVALAIARSADRAFHRIAGAQAHFADLLGRDVDVVGAGEIVGLRRAHEAEAVGQDFDHARADDLDFAVGEFLEDGKEEFGLGEKRGAFDLQLLGLGEQFRGRFFLEVVQENAFARFNHVIGHGHSSFQLRVVPGDLGRFLARQLASMTTIGGDADRLADPACRQRNP
jgi:hypothetical protein